MSMFYSNTAIINFEYTVKCQEKEIIIWVKKKKFVLWLHVYIHNDSWSAMAVFICHKLCPFTLCVWLVKGTPIEHGKKTRRSVKISSSSLTNKMLYKG